MASGELYQQGRVLELEGASSFFEGYERLLTDDSIHLVIIRGLINLHELDPIRTLKGTEAGSATIAALLPSTQKVNSFMADWWREHGYIDTYLDPHLRPSTSLQADESSMSHVDRKVRWGDFGGRQAGASLSVAGGENSAFADFYARRYPKSMRNKQGSISQFRYVSWDARANFTLRYPARVRQYPGDGVIMPQHPFPAGHRVRSYGGRWGKLFDYFFRTEAELSDSEARMTVGV